MNFPVEYCFGDIEVTVKMVYHNAYKDAHVLYNSIRDIFISLEYF